MKSLFAPALLAAMFGALATPAQAGFTITSFSAAQWGASDADLGIAGYVIEDFEDTTLIPDLQIGWTGGSGTIAPSPTLPRTFDPRPSALGGDDSNGNAFYSYPCGTAACSSLWDGTKVLVSGSGNQSHNYSDGANWADIGLVFMAPVRSVGFSLQQNEYSVEFHINGGVEILSIGGTSGGRYGYVRIDATGSDTISSLRLGHLGGDGWAIDHLAVAAVPEPETYVLLLGGIGLVGWTARRARR